MSVIAKSLIGLGAIGTIGGVGAYAGGLFSSKEEKKDEPEVVTISKKLTEEGFHVLDTTKDADWQPVLDEYKKATEKSFTKTKEANKTIAELRENCSRIINTNSKTYANYSLAKQWCVKKEAISAILGKEGQKFKFLGASDSSDWTTKINTLNNDPKAISSLGITKENTKAIEAKALQDKCTEIGKVETTADDFVTKFDLAKQWCSTTK